MTNVNGNCSKYLTPCRSFGLRRLQKKTPSTKDTVSADSSKEISITPYTFDSVHRNEIQSTPINGKKLLTNDNKSLYSTPLIPRSHFKIGLSKLSRKSTIEKSFKGKDILKGIPTEKSPSTLFDFKGWNGEDDQECIDSDHKRYLFYKYLAGKNIRPHNGDLLSYSSKYEKTAVKIKEVTTPQSVGRSTGTLVPQMREEKQIANSSLSNCRPNRCVKAPPQVNLQSRNELEHLKNDVHKWLVGGQQVIYEIIEHLHRRNIEISVQTLLEKHQINPQHVGYDTDSDQFVSFENFLRMNAIT